MTKEESAHDKLKELERQRDEILRAIEELKTKAIQELLDKRKEYDEQLNALGYRDLGVPSRKKRGEIKPGTICPICKFATSPAHDGRSHRNQNPKAPFSDNELKERELIKITP